MSRGERTRQESPRSAARRAFDAGVGATIRFVVAVVRVDRLVRRIADGFVRARALSGRQTWDAPAGRWRKETASTAWWRVIRAASFGSTGRQRPVLYDVRMVHDRPAGRRPRIINVLPNVFVGGSTQLVVDLVEHLGHKYDIEVVTAALPPQGRHSGMTLHRHPLPGHAADLAELFGELRPELLHVHYWGSTDEPWYRAVYTAAERRNLRVVQNINTPVVPFRSPTIVENAFVSDFVRQLAGPLATSYRVIHPGIDLDLFRPPAAFDTHAFDSLGMVYRLERDKLNEDSIVPLIEVARRRPRTRIFVIGDGALLPLFVRRAERAGVGDNFVFTGAVPFASLPEWYSRFRVFVAPVWQESWGQVTTFAMAMGLAVGGNRVGALPEILGSDDTLGRSPDETAAKLLALLEDRPRIEELGKRNREIALREYSVERMVESYDALYRDALGAAADGRRTAYA
jgi:glycosyltransferase involved in cell wall biosynthesis